MEIEHCLIPGDGCHVPAFILNPGHPRGAAIVVHGYGGNKKEQLGLGWLIAEAGLLACIIDLRGHGEHPLPREINAGSRCESGDPILPVVWEGNGNRSLSRWATEPDMRC